MKKVMLCACTAIALMFGLGFEVEGMNGNPSLQSREVYAFNATQPISRWPIYDPLSRTNGEFEYYRDKTWNASLTLAENQERLVNTFIEICLDFSPAVTELVGEGFLFRNVNAKIVTARCISTTQEIQVKGVIKKIAESAIGCKLLRVMTAKYAANNYSKVIFVSTENEGGEYEIRPPKNQSNSEYSLEHVPIFILPKILKDLPSDLMVTLDKKSGAIQLIDQILPLDAIFFHEFSHFLSPAIELLYSKYEMLQKRFQHTAIEMSCESVRICEKPLQFLKVLFSNDEDYRNMYGLSEYGFDHINEAIYMASNYGYIRACHLNNSRDLTLRGVSVTPKGFLSSFFKQYIDFDLIQYYLGDSKTKLPQFGKSQYMCSDISSK